jgi:hypothetical protein
VERSIALAFTTLTVLAPPAHAAHPTQAVRPEGTAHPFEFVATSVGAFCRQRQNSVALLEERRGATATGGHDSGQRAAGLGIPGGCSAGGGSSHGAIALALLALCRRRRR